MKRFFTYLLSLCAIVSCLQEERSPEEILVPTPAQVECSDESLMLTSKVPTGSEKLVKECGFYYSKDKSMEDTRKVAGVLAGNNFTAELPDRTYGTTYYICAYVTNGHGSEIRSDLRTFQLDELEEYVEFGALDMLSYDKNSSTLEITIDAEIWGGVKITEIGVCYGDSPTGLDIDGPHKVGVWNLTQTKGDAGVVTISIDGLSDATQYYFRGYLKDDDYISYSDVLPFYIPAIPAVQTGVVEDITPYTAVLYGEVLDECGSPVSERGFVWNEGTVAPTIESDKVVVDGALGVMSATAEELLPNRTYTFCAYAVNASGIAYGAPVAFTTLVALPDLSVADITAVTSNSATFGGTVTNDGGETVSEVGFYYSNDSAVDPEKSEKVSLEYADYQRSAAEYSANTLYSMMSASAETPAMSKASGVETKAASDGYTFSIDVYGLALKTRYYVKAYAVNSAGIAYGKVTNFETMGEIPTVKTSGTSELTTSSVVLSGEVVSDNGERISERGFVWMEGAGTPTTDSHKVKVSGTTGEYNCTLNNLQPNCKYSFCAYAINAEGTSYGEVITFTTMVALPTVTPAVVSSVTSTSATFAGTVKDHGGETVYEVGFYYSADSAVDPSSAQKKSVQYSADSFSIDITDLAVNTKYYVKSYAVNSAGPSYSTVTEFTTESSYPSVNTLGASDITESSALLSGEVVSDNGATITERGFVWVKGSDTPTTSSTKIKVDGTTGTFTATLSGIDPNQKYSFRAYAINSKGTAYGEVMSFSTSLAPPTVSSVAVSNITSNSVTASCTVTGNGGGNVTMVGFYYSEDPAVEISTSDVVTQQYSTDVFSMQLSDLNVYTKYYIKAFATNAAGTIYSDVVSFTTEASIPVVSTISSSDVTDSSALLSGEVLTDNGAAITERGFVWTKGSDAPTTLSNKLRVDGTTGSFTSTLSGLEPNQKYTFRAFAINAKGTSYGDPIAFTTVAGMPKLAAVEVSKITSTSATFSSKVIDHGGATVTEVGFYYSTEPGFDPTKYEYVSRQYSNDSFTIDVTGLQIYKKYYVKAYTINAAGTAYSDVMEFTTASSTPVVNTVGSSNVTSSGATLSGTVVTDNGAAISERGFAWIKGDGVPTVASGKVTASGATGDYTANLSNLEPNQKYSFCAYAVNSNGTTYGSVMTFNTVVGLPAASATTVSNVTSTSATFRSSVASHGGETVSEVGFYYSVNESVDESASTKVVQKYSADSFSADISGLSIYTKYYVKSYVKNSVGTVYGPVTNFMTSASTPVVNTIGHSNVTSNSAVLTGTVVTDNGASVTERGFVWEKGNTTPTTSSNRLQAAGTTGQFTATLSNVEHNQTYSYRAYAINAIGTSYGEVMTFSTSVGLPELSKAQISNITSTTATFEGEVLDNGGVEVTEVGFYYDTTQNVDPASAEKVSQTISAYQRSASTYSNSMLYGASATSEGSLPFSIDVTGLALSTRYYVKAYAINSAGVSYSEVSNFDTKAEKPSVKTLKHSDVTTSSAVLYGNVLADNGAAITERGFVWVKGASTPTTASEKLKVDGTTGEYSSTLTGIEPNQKYTFCAYAINAEGTTYGELQSFTTLTALPGIDVVKVSNVTSTGATFSSRVTDHGGSTVSEVGFYYSTDPEFEASASEKVSKDYSEDSFNIQVNDLQICTKYYVKAYIINAAGATYSSVISFTTEADIPTVNTIGTSDVTESGAVLSGTVVADNGSAVTERGFVWVKGTDTPTTSSNKRKVEGTLGDYILSLSDLEPNQKYSFRAYAINSKGTAYGEIKTFTTVAGLPRLSALGVSSITTTSATFTSTVTSHGGETVDAVGFYYSTSSPIDVESAEKVSLQYVEDRFTYTAEGLSVGTQYYVMAFASNTAGEVVNAEVGFKTVSTVPTIVTKAHSEITSSSAKLSGEVVLDNGEPITERGFLWLKGLTDPTASSARLKAEGTLGEYTSALTGLDPNQTYSYRAYATNSKGTAFGEVKNFRTLAALPEVGIQGVFEITSTTAEIDAKVTYDGGETPSEAGFFYGTSSNLDPETATKVVVSGIGEGGSYYYNFSGLKRATQYYAKPYATNSAGTAYGEVESFKTLPELPSLGTAEIINITETTAECGGYITDDGGEILTVGIVWSKKQNPTIDLSSKTETAVPSSSVFRGAITGIDAGFKYYVRAYAINSVGVAYGNQMEFTAAGEIQSVALEPANSFIISSANSYSFGTVKGNSYESVGSVSSAEVLWESFGTDETPEVGSLISFVTYKNDRITFATEDNYREGNAVIAAKDASGTILWSWHIWLTDQPEEQVYYNNAGTMMDRNLGAISATPGDVGALGLLYAWGRKDPFLGSSSITDNIEAKSTIQWPYPGHMVSIEYTVAHPTTYITMNMDNQDWHYTGSSEVDNTRWSSDKTIYDPCPSGWRVPDGGEDGVWATAITDSGSYLYDSNQRGAYCSGVLGNASIWYPSTGGRYGLEPDLRDVGESSGYWSVTPCSDTYDAYYFAFGTNKPSPLATSNRGTYYPVRCQKEGTGGGKKYDNEFSTSGARSLSDSGTANSYIVPNAGTYSISAVKGNSSESIGSVASAEVLWETFGTDEKVFKGSLVSGAKYENGKVYFKTADSYREGNAVIAVKDASGTILWSWHIWLTDQPEEHIYPNNAGTMMDRNLGATSATPGDVGALGLMYQWGRKDPFLTLSSISSYTEVKSTITWPVAVSSDFSAGTIEYATSHPTTFIGCNNSNDDWYYTGSSSTDNTRWESEKTIYDPCPVGWRVPDGGEEGIWAIAGFSNTTFDNLNKGISFNIDSPSTTWYPAVGSLGCVNGAIDHIGDNAFYWSVTPCGDCDAYYLSFASWGGVNIEANNRRSYGYSVRCKKEGTGGGSNIDVAAAKDLSVSGSANSYIVSNAGTYKIPTVKGNSSESVGTVASAEVLWESFGTSEQPSVGDLISSVHYEDGKIIFVTNSSYREGNAVIAVKDADGTILWSWHIWLTDQPQEQVYYNNAGTMMDRNLGATSATPGDVGALGLLYQWGRKDPFLGSSSIGYGNLQSEAKSTIVWPSSVQTNSSNGTMDFAIKHPTTYISGSDWYYNVNDVSRWQPEKTIYDPCPSGWRVPDGGDSGVWASAAGTTDMFLMSFMGSTYGINFSKKFGSDPVIWYPAWFNGEEGFYWSVTPSYDGGAYELWTGKDGDIYTAYYGHKAQKRAVRCIKEGTGPVFNVP